MDAINNKKMNVQNIFIVDKQMKKSFICFIWS